MRTIGEDLRLRVEGMDCPSCARKIEAAVGRIAGVTAVAVNVGAGTVRVAAVAPAPADDVLRTIRTLGYATALDEGPATSPGRPPFTTAITATITGDHGDDAPPTAGGVVAHRARPRSSRPASSSRRRGGRPSVAGAGAWPFVLATGRAGPGGAPGGGAVATGQVFTIRR
jgi:copper chaperone CopZ